MSPAQARTAGPEFITLTARKRLEEVIGLEKLVAGAVDALTDAPAEDVIKWATDTFGDRICITSSMTDAVLIHLASRVRPGHRRHLPGYRLSLRRDGRHQGRGLRRLSGQRDQCHTIPDRRGAGRRARAAAVRPQPGSLLLPPQGGAAGARPRSLRGLAHRGPQGRDQRPERHAGGGMGSAAADGQGQPDRGLDPGPGRRRTSPSTGCSSTRWSTTVARPSAARLAPRESSPAPIRAAAAGKVPARPNAASTAERRDVPSSAAGRAGVAPRPAAAGRGRARQHRPAGRRHDYPADEAGQRPGKPVRPGRARHQDRLPRARAAVGHAGARRTRGPGRRCRAAR